MSAFSELNLHPANERRQMMALAYIGILSTVDRILQNLFSPSHVDCPAPLVSSDRSVSVPVEASIEDLHNIQYISPRESIQADASPIGYPSALEEKLEQELDYHKHGNYNSRKETEAVSCLRHTSSNPFLQDISTSDNAIRQPEQDRPSNVSSVHSWTKAEPVQPITQEEAWCHPTSGHYHSMNSSTPNPSLLSVFASTAPLPQLNQQHPHSYLNRQQSWQDTSQGHHLAQSKNGFLQDPGEQTLFFYHV